MECFNKNAVFDNASGSEIFDKRFKGHKSLRTVFENLLKKMLKALTGKLLTKEYLEIRHTVNIEEGQDLKTVRFKTLTQ